MKQLFVIVLLALALWALTSVNTDDELTAIYAWLMRGQALHPRLPGRHVDRLRALGAQGWRRRNRVARCGS